MTGNEVFLDTSFALALTAAADSHHSEALAALRRMKLQRVKAVTSEAILFETVNFLSKRRLRPAALQIMDVLLGDPSVEIHPETPDLLARAISLFRGRMDKDWSLTDCLSFEIMRERGITDALTADEHFLQAGFRAMLRDR